MNRLKLVEPNWGIDLINWGIKLQDKYTRIGKFAPVGADIFVIIYPISLVSLYVYAMISKKNEEKQAALFVFFSTFFSVLFDIVIQSFFVKERPIVVLQLDMEETLLHEILPVSSFPSDHAVVSMSFAVAMLMRGLCKHKKGYIYGGLVLILVSFVMVSCRMLTLVHRPTDIIGGLLLGITVPVILSLDFIRNLILKFIINPIISFEKMIMKKVFGYEQ